MLERGRARVHRMYPFTIRLVDRLFADSVLQPVSVKLDPGSKTTGMAVVRVAGNEQTVLSLIELSHRGSRISEVMHVRNLLRHRRRSKLRYRPARYSNRRKPKGWIAPSLQHRVGTICSWINRLQNFAPVTKIVVETVRINNQFIHDPNTEVSDKNTHCDMRAILLRRCSRSCFYCGVNNVPLQIDHIVPKARGGADRLSNRTLACRSCNQGKGTQFVSEFLKNNPSVLSRVNVAKNEFCKDASIMNAVFLSLHARLSEINLIIQFSGGRHTKSNRDHFNIPKTHALDAACVGTLTFLHRWNVPYLLIKATGRGSYCRTRTDKSGFPRGYMMRVKKIKGFATGDIVQAVITSGVNAGNWVGRVLVRAVGRFDIQTKHGPKAGIHWNKLRVIQRADGYGYMLMSKTVMR